MQPDSVIQVVVRFGGDIVDVRYVDAVPAEILAAQSDLIAVELSYVTRPRRTVPHLRFDARWLAFAVASLAVHLGVLAYARNAKVDEPSLPSITTDSTGRHARIGTFAMSAQTVQRAPKPPPEEVAATTDHTPTREPELDQPRPGAQALTGITVDPPSRDEKHFDPDANPDFDTVKTGSYATLATGRSAGKDYGAFATRTPLIVVSCDAATCIVLGGDNAAPIRKAVEQHLAEITACYANEARAAGRKVEVDFGVNAEGKVGGVQVGGYGDVGTCVANIINGLDLEAS